MDPLALVLAPVAAFGTAIVSGALGMGGGMILLGLYLLVLPVPEAMLLHGVTQLSANGGRAYLLRRHVHGSALRPYLLAALAVLLAFTWRQVALEKGVVFVLLGGLPIALTATGRSSTLDFRRPRHAALCGASVTGVQLAVGASGPLLDVFFLGGQLDRHQVVATKALTQSCGHLLKILYFGALLGSGEAAAGLPWMVYPAVAVPALAGTAIGKRLLDRWNDTGFLRTSRWVVSAICVTFVLRGAAMLL